MRSRLALDHYRLIAARFPGITAEEIEVNTDGNDHEVYFVRRQVTFRFPREPRRISPKRKRFLDAFAQRSPVAVPLITIYHDEQTGSDYEVNAYLPGEPFDPALASTLSMDARQEIACQLGEYLMALHSFPLDVARSIGVDELDPATFGAYMEDNALAYPFYRRTVFPSLTDGERAWVERLFGGYIALVKAHPFAVRVAHADMWTYHILIDPCSASLTGVLDYWPRISDPASDFKVFEHYGSDFVATVYRHYGLPLDDSFEARRLFYTGRDQVAELARAIERGDPELIAARRESLARYIAHH